jgi:hypothetical protein
MPDFIVRDELAYNIGSLTFRYYDVADVQRNGTFDLSSTADDIGGAESESGDRSQIRRVTFELVGLALDPDPGWIDPADLDPSTRAFHKFRLAGNIRPHNLGMIGVRDLP